MLYMRYIWSKVLLLNRINEVINENYKKSDWNIFCDIFSWTASVGRYFKKDFKIISNDLLYFSYVIQRATIKNNQIPKFQRLKKEKWIDPFVYFKYLPEDIILEKKWFIYENYSPNNEKEWNYLTNHNALKIDYIRSSIEERKDSWLIDENEYYYLLAWLIEEVPSVSNIAWTYWAYLKKWDWRVFKELNIIPLEVIDNWYENECYNEDGNELIKRISWSILYMDPPYNTRQYLGNYHILETIAKYDSPEIKWVTWSRIDEKKKSKYCSKSSVLKSFEDMIKNAKFKNIILSYSTEWLMKENEIEEVMKKYWIPESFKIYRRPYRRYKRISGDVDVKLEELLFYIRKNA